MEERAVTARSSARLALIAGAVLFLVALAVPAAQAEQPEPVALTETSPLSSQAQPASSTTPFIKGHGDGAIATVVIPVGWRSGRQIAAVVNPNNEVELYANDTCAGSPVATDIVEELEGDGIQVEVEPDSITTFSARQVDPADPANPSICSKPITYWNSSTAKEPPAKEPPAEEPPGKEPPAGEPPAGESPPSKPPAIADRPAVAPPAPKLKTAPAGPANNNTPRVIGSASGADSVKIFSNSSCTGAPVATVSPAQLLAGVELSVPDNSTTEFAGIAAANGKQSSCSSPVTYVEDSTAPRTRITMGPGAKTRHHKVVFRFADIGGDPVGTSFICKVDGHMWKPCHSPFKLRHLSLRRHTLRIRGADPVGNVEAKAARRSFKVIHQLG